MAATETGRAVAGTIDTEDVYCSRAAVGGGYVFFAATALDESGSIPESARPPAPYTLSEAAKARFQTRRIFESYADLLPELGASITDIVQLEQYVRLKVHSDAYFQVALGPGFMETARPGAATAAISGFFPEDAVVSITGMAVVPDEASGRVKSYPTETGQPAAGRKFSDVVAAGPYVYTTYFPTDNKTGVDPAVLAPTWHWRGSEARSEAEFGVETLRKRLEAVGASLEDVVDYTVFLSELGDLYEFDLVVGDALGAPPSRTVIPARGFAVPRREGAVGHVEGAVRTEVQFRCLRPGFSATKEIIAGPSEGFGAQSAGVRVGELLWLSSQYAGTESHGDAAHEVDDVFAKLAVTCANGGTSLDQLLRVRALVTGPEHALEVYTALRRLVPADPPVVSILVVPPSLLVPGASVAIDGVAFVPAA